MIKPMEVCYLDLHEAARRVAEKDISPVELTETLLARIDTVDVRVRSYVTVLHEEARRAARVAEQSMRRGGYRGPLHGIPIAIKDLYNTKGVETTSCSKVRAGFIPDKDCTVVSKLREAGAVILGKVTTHEFAFGFDSVPTRNPWNLDHIPSGSSGGSGAALAAGLCFAATGSDTGGSIRAPAAANGIAGIKPTYGRVSKEGVAVLSWSLDHTGPMARSVRDLAIVLHAIAGFDPDDPHTKDVPVPDYAAALTGNIRGVRIGVPRNYFFDDVQAPVQDAVTAAIGTLQSLGANAVPVTIAGLDDILDCFFPLVTSEASTYHQKTLRQSPDLFGEDVRLFLETGELMLATTYITAQRARSVFKASFREALQDVDVMVTPTQPMTAPKVGQTVCRFGDREESVFAASARFCAPFNLSGLPAASVPCGFAPDGLPIGLQIVGKPFDEATVLRVADAFERHSDWHLRHPALK